MTYPIRFWITAVALTVFAQSAAAEEVAKQLEVIDLTEDDTRSIEQADYQWINRLLVVLADTPNDPRFIEQMDLLLAEPEPLIERDVIVLIDTDPDVASHLREELRPRGFAIVLVGKEGQIRLRKPFPWSVREIGRAIDKSPLRQRELRGGG